MNEHLIRQFYTCFQNRDWKGMQACYGDDAFFYDPVFLNLEGGEVRAMWEMLLRNAKDLQLSADRIISEDEYGSCHWKASYTFSTTGRPVVNKGKALMKIVGGKITEHQDQWSFWNWSRQALGLPGALLGWSNFLQRKVSRQARGNLDKFMAAGTASGSNSSQS